MRSGKICARFEKGVFVPSEPLDLPEGTEVIVDLHNPRQE
jgi:predicted DNA-binding antitoxin AbrB/MazE fold protein